MSEKWQIALCVFPRLTFGCLTLALILCPVDRVLSSLPCRPL